MLLFRALKMWAMWALGHIVDFILLQARLVLV